MASEACRQCSTTVFCWSLYGKAGGWFDERLMAADGDKEVFPSTGIEVKIGANRLI